MYLAMALPASRAEVLKKMIDASEGSKQQSKNIRWLIICDEADHLFGRGYAPGGKLLEDNDELLKDWAKSERILRAIVRSPVVLGLQLITATPVALITRGANRVLSTKYKPHTLALAESNY